mmetsp:Transcript_48205/g.138435  ORF Transcript_48205/g.138435 Transcript_48205/m.138435 type:complete len:106 (+) Transcript_48205:429-746(+)
MTAMVTRTGIWQQQAIHRTRSSAVLAIVMVRVTGHQNEEQQVENTDVGMTRVPARSGATLMMDTTNTMAVSQVGTKKLERAETRHQYFRMNNHMARPMVGLGSTP